MTVTVSLPEEFADIAAAQGFSVEQYLVKLAGEAVQAYAHENKNRIPSEAAPRTREARKGLTLGGLKVEDMIDEGRRH